MTALTGISSSHEGHFIRLLQEAECIIEMGKHRFYKLFEDYYHGTGYFMNPYPEGHDWDTLRALTLPKALVTVIADLVIHDYLRKLSLRPSEQTNRTPYLNPLCYFNINEALRVIKTLPVEGDEAFIYHSMCYTNNIGNLYYLPKVAEPHIGSILRAMRDSKWITEAKYIEEMARDRKSVV
jgi:hypothetical protein